ncbi:MAG: hypothetical protein QNJ11_11185 [Woeseiaceae bacterium]|nr:hypothetical protein [Woeseiaceae bacterium]
MHRVVASSILITTLVVGAVWLVRLPDNVGDADPVEQEPPQNLADTVDPKSAKEPIGLAATDPGNEIEDPSCDFSQLKTMQQFNRDNLQRLESSILSPEIVSSYRGLSFRDLDVLVEQDDSVAMMMYGIRILFVSLGRNPEIAVDYLAYGLPLKELTPNPNGVPDDAYRHASMARDVFRKAALHGRHAAFTFIGLTYEAQGKNAVDLGWITQDAFDSLDDDQKYSIEPRVAYSQLAYIIDPNILPVGSPNRELFDNSLKRLGEHAIFFDELEYDFRQRLELSGRSFRTLPPLTYPDVDDEVIAACEEAGYSQWPD